MRAEGAKAGVFDTQVRAYAATVQAVSARADIKAKGAQLKMDAARTRVADYGLRGVELGRKEAAEEVLADMAQNTPALHFVRRAIAAIRTWLRQNMPGFRALPLSDDEIVRNFILPARGWVERGQYVSGADGTETAFSRADGGGLPRGSAVVADYDSDAKLKEHPDYKAAKAGDVDAATRLVRDLVQPESLERSRQLFGKDAIFVPVHAQEASGKNQIPNMLALAHAQAAGGQVGQGIMQTNKAFHTGAGPMERLMNRAEFSGPVQAGKTYVLVDDVSTMGSTLADMAAYIQRNGARVAGSVLLANAARGGKLDNSPKIINELEARHGTAIREILDIDANQLTGPEAQYLIGFKSADEIRGRAAKAQSERSARLRSKEILSGRQTGVDQNDGLDGPLFSRDSRAGDTAFAADVMTQLGSMDQLYRWPASDKRTLAGVFADTYPSMSDVGDATRADEAQESGADRRTLFRNKDGRDFYVYEKGRQVWVDVIDPASINLN